MDGGQIAFGTDGGLLTVWRRDKAIVAAGQTGESRLSEQGLQPVVGAGGGAVYYLWQRGPRLMVKKSSAEPAVLAESGAFAAMTSASPAATPVAVWESTRDGAKTIFAQRLEERASISPRAVCVDFELADNHIRLNFRARRALWQQKTTICWRT